MRNDRKWPGFVLLFTLLGTLTGCASINKQLDSPVRPSGSTSDNKSTHYFAVLDELGPPASLTALPEGFAFQYEALKIHEQQFGISSDRPLLRWFKLAYGSATAMREVHVYVFNKNGYLQAQSTKRLKDNVGKGLSFQFIVKVTQIVDTSYLEKPSIQHTWGASLTRPLPIALNSAQSLDSGLHGLEQRGTPASVGQRTLEARDSRKNSRRSSH
ncbi:MAG: hypothetical protein AMJ68_04905 [Acidithiobacillales bacterium SG8_45]|jgi:hypothetical protein|nr:MAG: hypothetical protein AMJ68_04905 [Acidithiobacillales bacterium SG8_45]